VTWAERSRPSRRSAPPGGGTPESTILEPDVRTVEEHESDILGTHLSGRKGLLDPTTLHKTPARDPIVMSRGDPFRTLHSAIREALNDGAVVP
jgi:hypothetical protein